MSRRLRGVCERGVLPLAAAALVLPLAAAPAAAARQDTPQAEAPQAEAPPQPPLDADGLPDPAFWAYSEGDHAADWLDKPLPDAADIRARPAAWAPVLEGHGLHLDLEHQVVALKGATIHDARTLGYPIEYLVVTEMGSTHEALVLVRAQPSLLDACLKAAGLRPGQPTRFRLKEPPPSEEELASGRVSPWLITPASGPLLSIAMTWTDDGGLRHEQSLESLLVDARTGEVLADLGWIYTGSDFAEYRRGLGHRRWFKADVEGDVVAIYLAGLEVCLFERNSLEGLVDGFYFPHPERLPAPGTPVTLVFSPTGGVVEPSEAVELPPWALEEDEAGADAAEPDAAEPDADAASAEGGDPAAPGAPSDDDDSAAGDGARDG